MTPPAFPEQLRCPDVPAHRAKKGTAPAGRFHLNRRQGIALGALLLVVIIVVAVVVASGSSPKQHATGSNGSTTTITQPALASNRCPLTDVPAPGGSVPARPALGVKVGNEPQGARPQSGLNEADIVYDTPAEGFIMRYIAVYQCNDASSIGPTRSVRWVDWHILRQFIHPILAHAGGITPDVSTVQNSKWLSDANLLDQAAAAGVRITSRIPPDNLYTSTKALYGLFPKSTTPPKPVFTYTAKLPAAATPAASVAINFSYGTDVLWKWDPTTGTYLHTFSNVADIDTLTNKQVSTTNIVIQVVSYKFGPYAESPGGTGDVESQTLGSGTGWVIRSGASIKVTWHRPNLIDPMTFTDASGKTVGLAPGRTWVELVPDTTAAVAGNITITK